MPRSMVGFPTMDRGIPTMDQGIPWLRPLLLWRPAASKHGHGMLYVYVCMCVCVCMCMCGCVWGHKQYLCRGPGRLLFLCFFFFLVSFSLFLTCPLLLHVRTPPKSCYAQLGIKLFPHAMLATEKVIRHAIRVLLLSLLLVAAVVAVAGVAVVGRCCYSCCCCWSLL